MNNFNNSFEKDRDQVVWSHDLTCMENRTLQEQTYDLKECFDDKLAAVVREQCTGNYIAF